MILMYTSKRQISKDELMAMVLPSLESLQLTPHLSSAFSISVCQSRSAEKTSATISRIQSRAESEPSERTTSSSCFSEPLNLPFSFKRSWKLSACYQSFWIMYMLLWTKWQPSRAIYRKTQSSKLIQCFLCQFRIFKVMNVCRYLQKTTSFSLFWLQKIWLLP